MIYSSEGAHLMLHFGRHWVTEAELVGDERVASSRRVAGKSTTRYGSPSPVPPRIDIRALLLIALDEKPPPGLPDKVMARVAMLTTMVEFARMLGAAPIDWITQRSDPNDNGNHE